MKLNESHQFFARQFADLRAEGVGALNAAYFLWGHVTRRDAGIIHVSLKGWSAAMEIGRQHGGRVQWWGSACVVKDGQQGAFVPLGRHQNGPEIWGSNLRNGRTYSPIGSCLLKIPDTGCTTGYGILVRGGYTYNNVPPLPPMTSTTIMLTDQVAEAG